VLKQALYRALMLPIATSVGRTTTQIPGSIWATMVCGVLAHKGKRERLRPLLFCALNLRCAAIAAVGLGLWRTPGKSEKRLTFEGEPAAFEREDTAAVVMETQPLSIMSAPGPDDLQNAIVALNLGTAKLHDRL
jgi:hypothetical protein